MVGENGIARQRPAMEELSRTAARLAAKGKGLLASDESVGTIGKRIEKAGLVNTEVSTFQDKQTRSVRLLRM